MCEPVALPPETEGIVYEKETGELLSYNKKILKYDVFRIPEGVKKIPFRFFAEKLFAGKLILPSTLTYIDMSAFRGALIEEIVFLDGNKSIWIGSSAFADIKNLRRVTFPRRLRQLNVGAFENCTALSEVIFPTQPLYFNLSVGTSAFGGCALREVTLPEGVFELSRGAFEKNRRLEAVTLPRSLKGIEGECFHACPLKRMTYRGSECDWRTVSKASAQKTVINHYDNSRVGYDWQEDGATVGAWVDREDFELICAGESNA